MRRLRSILNWVGLILFLLGVFFMFQGIGILPFPPGSTMVGDQMWVINGSMLAVGGLVLVLIGRRLPRR